MSHLKLLLQVALRNLFSSKVNLIIGGILFFGTLLVVVGGALLDSMDRAMSRSIIGSVAGHLQVYSAASKEELALFGQIGGEPNLATVEDFGRLKEVVRSHPNVETVVPMGISGAFITSGNTVDLTLARLRELYRKRDAEGETPALREQLESLKAHVRHILVLLGDDLKKRGELIDDGAVEPAEVEALARARSDSFWEGFDQAPYDGLELLENRIAPQVPDGDTLYIRYVGTDLALFQKTFERMRVVDGQAVPPGQRGMLLSKLTYEDWFKLKTARRLDRIKEARELNKRTIAQDPQLQRWVKDNQRQTRELLFQLDAFKSRQATERLQRVLGSQETDMSKLLVAFFTMDDANFDARYAWFYAELAPLLELYRLRIGDDLALTTNTRTGYVKSVNVKVYGTYQFDGLEKSTVAGALSLMDLVSFRELYGFPSAELRAELEQLRAKSGVKAVAREDAEADLFGGDGTLISEAREGAIDAEAELGGGEPSRGQRARVYTQQELEQGVVLSAALTLKDASLLEQTRAELEQAVKKEGLPLRVVSWQKASGMIGSFVLIAKLVLYVAVFIIFVVALVIINNAVMMATMQRVREVGTMRAIGAQRPFVLSMVLVETVVLGLVFGVTGALVGGGIMHALGGAGIPAGNEALYFFFSGPRLYPSLSASNLVTAFLLVLGVCSLSTLYPAMVATRVSPLEAMQSDE